MQNLMCFAMLLSKNLPTTISSQFNFTFQLAAPLKIDQTIYDYIQNPYQPQTNDLTDISVHFLMNSTSKNNNPELGHIESIALGIQALSKYDMNVFENFVWSSESYQSYLNQIDNQTVITQDHIKAHKWSGLSKSLVQYLNVSGMTDTFSKDPCRFKTLKVLKYTVII